MAARDRFDITIKCPNGECNHSGIAFVSEDDYPFMKSPHFRIDEIPKGFQEIKMGNLRQDTYVKCLHCETEFHL